MFKKFLNNNKYNEEELIKELLNPSFNLDKIDKIMNSLSGRMVKFSKINLRRLLSISLFVYSSDIFRNSVFLLSFKENNFNSGKLNIQIPDKK